MLFDTTMNNPENARPPLPPFDREAAIQKVRLAEDAWNTRNPERVSLAYTSDSVWRNRSEFDDSGNWFRSYGNENWEFDEHGLMGWRIASINCFNNRSPSTKTSFQPIILRQQRL